MRIDIHHTAKLLYEHDNIVILTHRKPDGDAIGSAFALLYALQKMGKTARVECADPIPYGRYTAIIGEYEPVLFEAEYLVTVDTADISMLAGAEKLYNMEIGLCIDHHKSNTLFAEHTLLDAEASAAAEIVYHLIGELGIIIEKKIADSIFTGITTDTGCFRNANASAGAHLAAAGAISCGADSVFINKLMFETKSRGRLAVDKFILDSITYHLRGYCAVIYLEPGLAMKMGVSEEELDGISAFPRTVEGVLAGVTIRGNSDGTNRVSLRTHSPVDASAICAEFGGGGHTNAAGCTVSGEPEEVKEKLLRAVERELKRHNTISLV